MPANRDIRDRYTDAIGAMEAKHRTMGVGHQFPKNTSLAQCIGYARRFVIESPSGDPHYRYDRYMCGLKATLRQYPVSAGTVVHVDIGCGPGLFTWVVRDYFRNIPQVDVELYGYDHAPKMVKLARLIWEYMEECVYYSVHDRIDDLFSTSMPGGPRPSAVLVTLGHVLVQTANDESAMRDFASIIATFARLADCRMVAVDALSGRWPTDFQRACGQLRAALEKLGSIVDIRVVDRSEMRGVVRVASQP